MNHSERIKTIKIHVDKTAGPTFCLAKWHHVTMYLQSGETHSCYHPRPHRIPLNELAVDPSALHNTEHKKAERAQMIRGEKPEGCQYCWNIEAMGPDYISDRHERNSSLFTEARFRETLEVGSTGNINPEYVEINFGNECNFKCGYCHPKYSTSFYNEIKKHGPVTTVRNHRCDIDWMKLYSREDENPYVDAWWRWWPELRKTLNILRITGGEPLLHTSTWRLLDHLQAEPLPHLQLNINSNLGVKSTLVERMSTQVRDLQKNGNIKNFKLFSSIDTWGRHAEYIRTGLDLELWQHNLHTYLTTTNNPITFMITFNILSVSSFRGLLEKILEWRKQYGWYDNIREHRIRFDTPYLREPLQYSINLLPKDEWMPVMQGHLDFMKAHVDNTSPYSFTEIEYEKFRRVVDYMATTELSADKLQEGRRDFYNWFTELDHRRNTNFQKTFPEMQDFYTLCKAS